MEGEEEHSQCSVPPPSPLTGCYLLVVVGEPRAPDHKEIILQRIVKGLLSWDSGEHQVDLEKELATLTAQAPEGEEARYGERLIQFASENLVTEILIHPQMNTLMQCMRNLLSSFTRHRHLVHAGYTSAGNGSWIMQDGTFSLADFIDAYQENEVQRVIRAYENSISIDIHCSTGAGVGGEWMKLPDLPFVKYCKIRVNPTDILDSGCKAIKDFIAYLEPYIIPASLEQLLVASDVIGSIRFSHPTLYVFPGGQGDAALFGINGFNMLVDGGFSRKACWWDFARHLDRLDAVLFTRLNNCSVAGMSAVLKRKAEASVYPQIGHFFCNLEERRCASPDGDKDCDPLLVSPLQQGAEMMVDLRHINLKPQHCYRSPDPVNLYHKVGHGTLDMYVLNPSKDSKHVREFLKRWHSSEQKLFEGGTATGPFSFPIPNLVSICALLVWRPANPDDNITRIMFPGSTPQHKIFEGLEKLKHLEFLHYPTITGRQMSALSSQIVSATKTSKTTAKIVKERESEKAKDEILSSADHFPSKINNIKDADSRNFIDNKLLSEIADNEKSHIESLLEEAMVNKSQIISDEQNKYQDNVLVGFSKKTTKKRETIDKRPKYVNKSDNTKETKSKQISSKKLDTDNKTTVETKKKADNALKSETVLSSTRSKYSQRTIQKTMEKKSINVTEKKHHDKKSPPETPKKQTDTKLTSITQITAKDKEIQKSRTRKLSPGSTSGKSTKEANNRRVAESKYKQMSPKRESSVRSIEKKDIKSKREPISRRPRPISSPIKGLKAVRSPTKTVKLTKVDPKLKGMQRVNYEDILMEAKKSDEDTSKSFDDFKQHELDEKEEQEIVKEIEAVFNKDSETEEKQEYVGHSDIEKITCMLEKGKTTLDGEFEEEYLIIEKEEVPPYLNTDVLDTKLSTQIDSPKTNKEHDAAKFKEIEKKQLDSKEHSISLEEKQDISSEKKTSDSKNEIQKTKLSTEHVLQDSQPDEKVSTTVESGATTAPTLPEDERITLDEIKEDKKTEEKLDSDLHKEFVPPTSLVDIQKQPLDKGNKVENQRSTIRDVVKTPDEVADLPLHEEADFVTNEDKKSPSCEPKLKSAEINAQKIPSELHLRDKDTIQSDVVIKTVERMSHAEIVTVTPGSAPESPMYPDAKKITAYSDKSKRDSDEETYGYSQFTEKLRETHITTIDSPIKEEIESVDGISCLPEKITSIPEDAEKEIEEERKLSLTEKLVIVSPKDVEKIVVDVAEVLKSEKTLDQIIKSPKKSLKSPVISLNNVQSSETEIEGISDSVLEINKQAYTENLTKTLGKQSVADNIQHDSIVKTQKDISPARSVTSEDFSDTSAKTVLSETKKIEDLNTNYEHKLQDDKLEKKMGVMMESAKTLEKLEEKICEFKKTTDEKICASDYGTSVSITLPENESALADDANKDNQNEVFEKDVTHKEIDISKTSTIGRDGESRVGRPIELPINQDEPSNIEIADSIKTTEVSASEICMSPPLHEDISQVIQNDRSAPEDKNRIEISKNKTVNETFVHKFPESYDAISATKEEATEIDDVIEKNMKLKQNLASSPTDSKYDEKDETSVSITLQEKKSPEAIQVKSSTKVESPKVIEEPITKTDSKNDKPEENNLTSRPIDTIVDKIEFVKEDEKSQCKVISETRDRKASVSFPFHKDNSPDVHHLKSGNFDTKIDKSELVKEDYISPIETIESEISNKPNYHKTSVSLSFHEDRTTEAHDTKLGTLDDIQKETDDQADLMSQKHDLPKESKQEHKTETPSPTDIKTDKSEFVKKNEKPPIKTVESEIITETSDLKDSLSLLVHEDKMPETHDAKLSTSDEYKKESNEHEDLIYEKYDLARETKTDHKAETSSLIDMKANKSKSVKKDDTSPFESIISTETYDQTSVSKSLHEDKSSNAHDTKLSFSDQGHLKTSKEEALIDEKHDMSKEAKPEDKTPTSSSIDTKDDESNLVKKDEVSSTFESEIIYKTPEHEDQSLDVQDAKSGTTDHSYSATKDTDETVDMQKHTDVDNKAAISRPIDTKGGKSELVKEDPISLIENVETEITIDTSDLKTSVSLSFYEGKSPETYDANLNASDQSKKETDKQADLMLRKHDSPKETKSEHKTETSSLIDTRVYKSELDKNNDSMAPIDNKISTEIFDPKSTLSLTLEQKSPKEHDAKHQETSEHRAMIDKEHDIPREAKPEEKTPTSIPIDTKAAIKELVKKDEKSSTETVESEIITETANRKASVSLSFHEDKSPDVNDAELGTIDTKVYESELVKEDHISPIKTVKSEIKIDTPDSKTSVTLPYKEDKSAEDQVAKLGTCDHMQKETDDQADLKHQKLVLQKETKPEQKTETPSLIDTKVNKSELDINLKLIAHIDSNINNEVFDEKISVSQNVQEDGIPKAHDIKFDSSEEDHQETSEQGTMINEKHDTLKEAKPDYKTSTTSQIDTKTDSELVIKDDKSPIITIKSDIITETPDRKVAVSFLVHEDKSPDVRDTNCGTIDTKVDESELVKEDHISPIENIKNEISINTIDSKKSESKSFFEIKSPEAKDAQLGTSDQSKKGTDEQADLHLQRHDLSKKIKSEQKTEQKNESPSQIDTEVDKTKPDKKDDTSSIAPFKSKISAETYDDKTSVFISLHEDKSPKAHDMKLSFSDEDRLETSKEEALKDKRPDMPKEEKSEGKTLTSNPIATKTDESELIKKEEEASNKTVESEFFTETPNRNVSVSLSSFEDKSPEAHEAKLGRLTDQSKKESDKQADLMLQKQDSPKETKPEQKTETPSQVDTEVDKTKLDKKDDTSSITPFESKISTETYDHKTSVSISFHEDKSPKKHDTKLSFSDQGHLKTSMLPALVHEKHDMQNEAKSEGKTLTSSPVDTKADESELVKKEEKSPKETVESEIITETSDRKASESLLVHEDISPDVQDEKLGTIDTIGNKSGLVKKDDLIAPIDHIISTEVFDQKSSVSLTFQGDRSPKAYDIKLSFSDQGHLETSKQEALIDEKHDMQKEAKSEGKTLASSPIDTKADESELVKKEEKSPNETVESEVITETSDRKASMSSLVQEDISPDVQDEKFSIIDEKVNESDLVKEDDISSNKTVKRKINIDTSDPETSVSLSFLEDKSPKPHDAKLGISDQSKKETKRQEDFIHQKHDLPEESKPEHETETPSLIDTEVEKCELDKKGDSSAPIDNKLRNEIFDQKSSETFQKEESPKANVTKLSFSGQGHQETSEQEILIHEKHDISKEIAPKDKTPTSSPIDKKADKSELVNKDEKSPIETVESVIVTETLNLKASVPLSLHEDKSLDIHGAKLGTIDRKVYESELVKDDHISPIETVESEINVDTSDHKNSVFNKSETDKKHDSIAPTDRKISTGEFDQKSSVSVTFQQGGSPKAHDTKLDSYEGHQETSELETNIDKEHDEPQEATPENKTSTSSQIDTKADSELVKDDKSLTETVESKIITEKAVRKSSVSLLVHGDKSSEVHDVKLGTIDTKYDDSDAVKKDHISPIETVEREINIDLSDLKTSVSPSSFLEDKPPEAHNAKLNTADQIKKETDKQADLMGQKHDSLKETKQEHKTESPSPIDTKVDKSVLDKKDDSIIDSDYKISTEIFDQKSSVSFQEDETLKAQDTKKSFSDQGHQETSKQEALIDEKHDIPEEAKPEDKNQFFSQIDTKADSELVNKDEKSPIKTDESKVLYETPDRKASVSLLVHEDKSPDVHSEKLGTIDTKVNESELVKKDHISVIETDGSKINIDTSDRKTSVSQSFLEGKSQEAHDAKLGTSDLLHQKHDSPKETESENKTDTPSLINTEVDNSELDKKDDLNAPIESKVSTAIFGLKSSASLSFQEDERPKTHDTKLDSSKQCHQETGEKRAMIDTENDIPEKAKPVDKTQPSSQIDTKADKSDLDKKDEKSPIEIVESEIITDTPDRKASMSLLVYDHKSPDVHDAKLGTIDTKADESELVKEDHISAIETVERKINIDTSERKTSVSLSFLEDKSQEAHDAKLGTSDQRKKEIDPQADFLRHKHDSPKESKPENKIDTTSVIDTEIDKSELDKKDDTSSIAPVDSKISTEAFDHKTSVSLSFYENGVLEGHDIKLGNSDQRQQDYKEHKAMIDEKHNIPKEAKPEDKTYISSPMNTKAHESELVEKDEKSQIETDECEMITETADRKSSVSPLVHEDKSSEVHDAKLGIIDTKYDDSDSVKEDHISTIETVERQKNIDSTDRSVSPSFLEDKTPEAHDAKLNTTDQIKKETDKQADLMGQKHDWLKETKQEHKTEFPSQIDTEVNKSELVKKDDSIAPIDSKISTQKFDQKSSESLAFQQDESPKAHDTKLSFSDQIHQETSKQEPLIDEKLDISKEAKPEGKTLTSIEIDTKADSELIKKEEKSQNETLESEIVTEKPDHNASVSRSFQEHKSLDVHDEKMGTKDKEIDENKLVREDQISPIKTVESEIEKLPEAHDVKLGPKDHIQKETGNQADLIISQKHDFPKETKPKHKTETPSPADTEADKSELVKKDEKSPIETVESENITETPDRKASVSLSFHEDKGPDVPDAKLGTIDTNNDQIEVVKEDHISPIETVASEISIEPNDHKVSVSLAFHKGKTPEAHDAEKLGTLDHNKKETDEQADLMILKQDSPKETEPEHKTEALSPIATKVDKSELDKDDTSSISPVDSKIITETFDHEASLSISFHEDGTPEAHDTKLGSTDQPHQDTSEKESMIDEKHGSPKKAKLKDKTPAFSTIDTKVDEKDLVKNDEKSTIQSPITIFESKIITERPDCKGSVSYSFDEDKSPDVHDAKLGTIGTKVEKSQLVKEDHVSPVETVESKINIDPPDRKTSVSLSFLEGKSPEIHDEKLGTSDQCIKETDKQADLMHQKHDSLKDTKLKHKIDTFSPSDTKVDKSELDKIYDTSFIEPVDSNISTETFDHVTDGSPKAHDTKLDSSEQGLQKTSEQRAMIDQEHDIPKEAKHVNETSISSPLDTKAHESELVENVEKFPIETDESEMITETPNRKASVFLSFQEDKRPDGYDAKSGTKDTKVDKSELVKEDQISPLKTIRSEITDDASDRKMSVSLSFHDNKTPQAHDAKLGPSETDNQANLMHQKHELSKETKPEHKTETSSPADTEDDKNELVKKDEKYLIETVESEIKTETPYRRASVSLSFNEDNSPDVNDAKLGTIDTKVDQNEIVKEDNISPIETVESEISIDTNVLKTSVSLSFSEDRTLEAHNAKLGTSDHIQEDTDDQADLMHQKNNLSKDIKPEGKTPLSSPIASKSVERELIQKDKPSSNKMFESKISTETYIHETPDSPSLQKDESPETSHMKLISTDKILKDIKEPITKTDTKYVMSKPVEKTDIIPIDLKFYKSDEPSQMKSAENMKRTENHNINLNSNLQVDINDMISSLIEPNIYKDNNIEAYDTKSVSVEPSGESLTSESYCSEDSVKIKESKVSKQNSKISESDQGRGILQSELVTANTEIICEDLKNEASGEGHVKIKEMSSLLDDDIMKEKSEKHHDNILHKEQEFPITCESISTDVFDSGTYSVKENETIHKQSTTSAFSKFSKEQSEVNNKKHEAEESYFEKTLVSDLKRSSCHETYQKSATDHEMSSLSTIDSGILDHESTICGIHGSSSEDVSKEISLEEKYSFESNEKAARNLTLENNKVDTSGVLLFTETKQASEFESSAKKVTQDDSSTLEKRPQAPVSLVSPNALTKFENSSRKENNQSTLKSMLNQKTSKFEETEQKAHSDEIVQQGIKSEEIQKSFASFTELNRVSTPPTVPASPLAKTPTTIQDSKSDEDIESNVLYDKLDGTKETITKVVHVGEDVLTQKISTSAEKVPRTTKSSISDVDSEADVTNLMHSLGKIKTETDTVTKIIKEGENVVTQTITTVTTKEIVSREDGTPQNVKTTIETTTLSKGSDGSTSTITDTQTLLSECSSSLKSSSQMDLYGHEEKEDELCCKIAKEEIARESDKAFTNKSYLDQSNANENLMIIKATNEYEENIEDTVIDTDVSKRIIKENNCDIMETVTTITKKETLKNDTNKNIIRTTVEKNITKERPDGSSNVNKNVDVTIIETLNTEEEDLLTCLDEFAISDGPKEDVSINTEQIEENNFLIDRKIVTTVVTTKYKHKIYNSQVMKVETTVSTIDNYPDGNCYSTTNKSTKIISFDKEIEETDSEKQMHLDTNKESTYKMDSCNDDIKNITQESDNFTSANIETVLKDLTSEKDAEESETCDVIQIKEKDFVVQRTIKSKIIRTKFCDKNGVPKKLKTVTVVTTTDRYPDGSEKTKIDTKHEISEIDDSSVICTAMLEYDNLESRSVKEDKYEKTVCRNGLDIQQQVIVKEITEIFTSVTSTKKKKKITTETITESHLPDGKIECTKDVNVVVSDCCDDDKEFDMETLSEKIDEVERRETEPHCEENDIVEDVTEETDIKNETIKQGQLTIKRTITTKTKRETLPTNDDNLRRVRTTVETTTIDENPDGSTETTKDVKITISESHKTYDFDLQNALRELVPTGKTQTTVDKKQNEFKENDIQIIQTITKYTTKEEYLNPKSNEIAVKTVIETITENSKEDGSIKTSKDIQTEVIYLPKGTDLDDWSPENKKEVSCDFTVKDVNVSSKDLSEEQHNKMQYYSIGEKITDTSTTVNLLQEGDNEITQTITVVTTKEVISPEKIKTTVETTTTSKSIDGKTKTTKSTKTFISDLNEANLAQLESGFSLKSDNISLDTYEDVEALPESKISPKTTLEATSTHSTYCSDEEYPESPSSTKSQIAHSPRSNVSFELHDKIGVGSIDNKDLMCTSLYGELPEDVVQSSTLMSIKKETEQFLSEERNRSGHTKLIEFSNSSFLSEADKHFEKAIEEHKKVSGSTVISNVTAKYELDHGHNLQTEQSFVLKDVSKCNKEVSDTSTSSQSGTQPGADNFETERTGKNQNDPIESWGKPLGLPSPTQPSTQSDGKGTPKKQTPTSVLNKNKINQEKSKEAKSRASDSPSKKKSTSPVYMELTYVPHHGNSYYSAVEFFKKVRARYYVFSGTEPSRDIYNALLDAKKTWENKDLEVTIIPTYDTDVLGYWVTENEEALEKYKIDLSPSASRCTINLQDHETSCAAYRLEF